MIRSPDLRQLSILVAVLVLACLALDGPAAMAQGAAGPFGIGSPEAGSYGATSGILGWIAAKQSAFYQDLKAALKAIRTDPHAAWLLVAGSFGYGVLHAAGPGHGKAVIASYVIANRQTLVRGIALSFVSAFFQGLVAIVFVGVARFVFNVTAVQMSLATEQLELTSALMITALGVYLVATKVMRLGSRPAVVLPSAAADPARSGPAATALFGGSGHVHDASCAHVTFHSLALPARGTLSAGRVASAPVAMVCADCGHTHMPDPAMLQGPLDWRKALSAIIAVGIRPCSGAIIMLVFAFTQGFYAAGMLSVMAMALGTGLTVAALASLAVFMRDRAVSLAGAESPWGLRIVRSAEIAAAFAVLAMGGLLLGATVLGGGAGGS